MNKRDKFIKGIMELGIENASLMTSNEDAKNNIWKAKKLYVKYFHKADIDKVTTSRLEMALRMSGIFIDANIIDNIIDVVKIIEEKGRNVSLKDISKLKEKWDNPIF